ncbi:MAG: FecR domain-containing protein, partial [Planctomycetes bacterium]|nr:FecR domain-containing protein [Planctomycetota bacterium]
MSEQLNNEALKAEFDELLLAAFEDHPFGEGAVAQILAGLPESNEAATVSAAPSSADAPKQAFPKQGILISPRWLVGAAALAAALFLGGLLLDLISPTPVAPTRKVAVREVVGTVGPGFMRLADARSSKNAELNEGAELHLEDTLVAIGQSAELRLSDGTRVAVHADTEFRLEREVDGGLTIRLTGAEGRVFCEVAKQKQGAFRVAARGLDVKVLGTRFVVEQGVRSSRVTVVEGRVEASGSVDSLVLGAGDQAEANLATGWRLGHTQVTPRRAALWVPALRQEQEALDNAEAARLKSAAPAERPRPRPTAGPA